MTLATYMAAVTASVSATGERTGRQMVLAVDCSEQGNAEISAYAVVASHIETHGAALNAKTVDKAYIGEGDSTLKTSTQRTFDITGQLLRGDDFHDFVTSFDIVYGVGSEIKRKYVYFDPGTGKGETGTVSIIVNNDGAAGASDPADISVRLAVDGKPDKYTYSSGSGSES